MFKNRKTESKPANASNIYEIAAKQYLVKRGLVPLTDNYHCRAGEIDLIMRDTDTLAFIEVRFRKNQLFGGGAASVTSAKQRKLIRAARHYLHIRQYTGNCRFDVVDVTYAQHNTMTSGTEMPDKAACDFMVYKNVALQFNWIKNAFLAE